ncbi:puromycin-sensitive aminopeptidase-like protein, partial [Leptotrombidium deliense]
MPVLNQENVSENEKKTVFAKIPNMSSYLVCIVVGDFDFVERKSIDENVNVRVYSPVGRKAEALFALDVAVHALDYFSKYLGIDFPLPKMDIVGVRDMGIVGMENWGLILQHEAATLFHKSKSSTVTRQRVATLVIHEIAHQYFGDLTTNWWTDIWLKEGIAEFFERSLTTILFPEWKFELLTLQNTHSNALFIDSFKSSYALKIPYLNQSEMDPVLGNLIYDKGPSLVRMIQKWIGDEAFRKGLNFYLNNHQYSNAETDDMLDSFDRFSDKNVKNVMNRWFKVEGYPMIKISQNKKCKKLSIKQMRFRLNACENEEEINNEAWKIPVKYITDANSKTKCIVMKRKIRK